MNFLLLVLFLFISFISFSQGLLINAGQFRVNAGHVVIVNNGNWTNNGTVNCVTGSTVDMAGNAIQNILGANTTAFSNLNINSTSSVFVGRNITINDNLQLTLGYFDLRGAITYLGNTSGNITGGETETKRIRATTNAGGTDDGVGVGTIQTTRTNPNGNIANLGLDFNGLTLGSTTIIRGHKQQIGTGSFSGNYSVFRYYDIQPTVQSNVTINNFNYFHAELGTQAANEDTLEMFQWVKSGTPQWWMPRTSLAFPASNYVSSTTTTNELLTYKITLGSTKSPLPIELLSFKAECNNMQNILTWQTASEQNNNYFTLEKSFDGENFIAFTQVQSQGNSNNLQNYSDIDYSPFNGNNYYRLKQTDLDGQYTYSDIISLNCNSNNFNEDILPISPSNGNVNAFLQGIPGNKYQIKLTNLLGQVISNKEIILNDYQQSINIYDSNLAVGMYYVILQTEKKNISKPIVIGN